jgi:hypothetical protein
MKGWIPVGLTVVATLVVAATGVARGAWSGAGEPPSIPPAALQLEDGVTPETMPFQTCGEECTHQAHSSSR